MAYCTFSGAVVFTLKSFQSCKGKYEMIGKGIDCGCVNGSEFISYFLLTFIAVLWYMNMLSEDCFKVQ